MKKNLQRMVAIGLLCAMTATRLMQGKAEFISAKDTVKEYVLTVDNEKDFNKIKKQYKENVVEDYHTYDITGKKSIYIGLTERQKDELQSIKGVSDIETNIEFSASGTNNEVVNKKDAKDPDADNWNMQMIGATKKVIDQEKNSKIKVAIMDSGVDYSQDVNVVERVNLVDDEKNIAPYYEDITSHGTSVAGIVADIAPKANLYSVRVLDANNTATLDRVIEGIYWCIDNHMDIINMSFGTDTYSVALEQAICDAEKAGILLLASAGNGGNNSKVEYPAAFEQVIAVGSVDKNAELTKESATGTEIELVAPGSQILTDGAFGGTLVAGGTSLSVAHVTGAAAIIWQQDLNKKSQFIRTVLAESSRSLGEDNKFGNGLIDVKYALEHYKQYEENYRENAVETMSTEIVNDLENREAVKVFDEVALVEGQWSSEGHQKLIDDANGLPGLEVGFTSDEMVIIKDACAKVDGIIDHGTNEEASLYYFREATDNILHGRYNYISTMRYLYRVCRGVYTSSDVTSCCNSLPYSPYTDYPDLNQKYSKNLKKAIVYMTSSSTPIATRANIPEYQQKGLHILGMLMHLVGDTYAHKTQVPKDCITKGEITKEQMINKAYWNEFSQKIQQGMMFNKIKKYLGSGYEDNAQFYSERYNAAKEVSNNILRHFAAQMTDVAFPEAMYAARKYDEKSIFCEETRLAYFSKHVRWEYNDLDRACRLGVISFTPGEGEYINVK